MVLNRFDSDSGLLQGLSSKAKRNEVPEAGAGFSTRLWNMSTAVGFNEQVSRLLREPDGGVSCLKELNDCAELLGRRQPSID